MSSGTCTQFQIAQYETRTLGGVRGAPVGLTAHRPSTRLATVFFNNHFKNK